METNIKQKQALHPFHNNILLTEIEGASKTEGGILIPEAYKVKLSQGTVVDKGPDVTDQVKLGDILFFPFHTESRLDYKGNKFIVVSEAQVLGAIRPVTEPV